MGGIMNSPNGVQSGIPESEHFLPDMWHPSRFMPKSYMTVSEQTIQHMWHRGVKFVDKLCMTTIKFPKSSLKFPSLRISLLQ